MLITNQRVTGLSGEKVNYLDLGLYSKILFRGIETYFQNQPQCFQLPFSENYYLF